MPITYDSIGNPLTDGVWEYIWQHGRQLSSMYGEDVGGDANDITIEYTYDANGMRIGKIVTKRNYLTHQHSYTETVVPPTCTEGGYTLHECACGDTYQDSATPALGHSYANTVVQSTCTGEGYTVHTCSVCGDSYQDNTTPALGHSYTDTVTPPTCTETGYTTHTCSVCGYSYQSDETAALGHSYTTTIVAPTCTQRGYTRHECSACGDSYQDTYVAALGHNYFLVKDPSSGQEIYCCIRCGHIKVEDEIPIIPVDPPVEAASYSLTNGSGESGRVLDSTVVQEYAYVYNGSSLMQMVVQTTVDDGEPVTETLYFSYDATGNPMSVLYNGTDYFYTVSLQGDVTAILNTSGTAVVEYTYDAWGNILSITGSMADTLGAVNPLTYRGYVYDTETGLHYVSSRYYDPEISRWISPEPNIYDGECDENAGFIGYNVYAYCANNPVIFKDETGESITLACVLIFGGIGLLAGGHFAAKASKANLGYVNGWWVLGGIVVGGGVGALLGWGVGSAAAAIGAKLVAGSGGTLGTVIYSTWQQAEQALRSAYNGIVKTFSTPWGNRIVDSFSSNNVIREAKYGYQGLSQFIQQEINKDAWLLQNKIVKAVEWHFYWSSVSNSGGPSGPLLEELARCGIKVVFH